VAKPSRISTVDTAYAGFTTVSPGGSKVEIRIMPEELPLMPRNKPALVSSLVRPGESRLFKTNLNHRGHFPVIASLTRFIPILTDSLLFVLTSGLEQDQIHFFQQRTNAENDDDFFLF